MNRTWILTLATLALVGCATSTPPPSTAVPEISWDQIDRADGETLYGNLCASCHGPTGRGDGPVAEVLSVEVPDLTSLSASNGGKFPLARVESSIYGRPEMPLWGPALEGVFDDLPRVNREAFAANRIRRLSRHLESLQVED